MASKPDDHDRYIADAPAFARPILQWLRVHVHQAVPGVQERMRWNTPFFDHNGILAGMAAFMAHVSFGLWRAGELDDPAGLFRHRRASAMNFTPISSLDEVPDAAVLCDYLRRAAALNVAGPKPAAAGPNSRTRLAMPPDFRRALAGTPGAAAQFEAFTPARQREYLAWILEARRDATRERRIAQACEWIAEGKPRTWKYRDC